MPTGTGFKPVRTADFTADKLLYNGTGVSGTAALGVITNIDYVLTSDVLITGMQLMTKGSVFGDNVSFQVIMPGTTPAVLNQFVTNWQLRDDAQQQISKELSYPAKIVAGMALRLVYSSVGAVAVKIGINYDLHTVLV